MRKALALLTVLIMLAVPLSGCIDLGDMMGYSEEDLVEPVHTVIDRPDTGPPSPQTDVEHHYSYQLHWTITEVYRSYGGVMDLKINNTGDRPIHVYGFGVDWVNSTVETTRNCSVQVQPGTTEELGLLFLRAPGEADSGIYQILIWMAVADLSGEEWHDYGRTVGAHKSIPLKACAEERNYTVSHNPIEYYNRINGKVDYQASEAVADRIRSDVPMDRSVNQIAAAFQWVRDNVEYKSDAYGDYWQSASETLERGTGDCEDQAILLTSIYGALGLQGRVNIIDQHAFASVYVGNDSGSMSDVEETLESVYWTDLPMSYLQDDYGYWLITDTTGFIYPGGLPAKSSPLQNGTQDQWVFDDTDSLRTVDATGERQGGSFWPFVL
ncbi:MAG: transglutaminase-like domain-containing protein [Methanomassiliicoccales archaeon]